MNAKEGGCADQAGGTDVDIYYHSLEEDGSITVMAISDRVASDSLHDLGADCIKIVIEEIEDRGLSIRCIECGKREGSCSMEWMTVCDKNGIRCDVFNRCDRCRPEGRS